MGMFLYLPHGISSSPYSHLLDPNLWVEIYDVFTRDACSLLGLSVDSPLSVWWVSCVVTFIHISCFSALKLYYAKLYFLLWFRYVLFDFVRSKYYVTLIQLLRNFLIHVTVIMSCTIVWLDRVCTFGMLRWISSPACAAVCLNLCHYSSLCYPLRKVAPVHTVEWPLFLYFQIHIK
jgi:hypothetical protein